ncbi:uncharacterized protein LOC130046380 [Ostrea edulis]|uniref:uncharacterized protein LOC130046380 n=1 Tax=Ostrea edulis TaxID=37623 RepID=UPI0024AF0C77|nr:uncharacterized protein LOC130046380 [Ostrea edulis]
MVYGMNMKSTQGIFRWTFFVILYLAETYGYTVTYEFGKDCSVFLEDLDENRQVYVEYNGGYVGIFCNDISFNGKGDEIMDEYEVCVTPQYFEDPDCAIELEYKASVTGGTLRSVTCASNYNEKLCGAREKSMFIYLEKRNGKDTSHARFKLLVTANKVFDYGSTVGAVIGGLIGGIAFIACVAAVVCHFVCKRKATQGQILGPSPTVQTPMLNQQAYPYTPTNYQQPSMNTNPYPITNYSTPYSAEYNMQSQPQPEQREPEQREPEQREPEQREPEQREPEQREPEQREPEQREPEQREQREPEQREQREPEQREPEQPDVRQQANIQASDKPPSYDDVMG